MVFTLPLLDLEVGDCTGYFLVLVAVWMILGRTYPLLGFIKSQLPRGSLTQKYGRDSWAVVTGASRGIGRAFCDALAAEGFNIALIVRGNVQPLAQELERRYKVKTRTITCDFEGKGKFLKEYYEKVWAQLGDLDVSIVVNDVGVAFDGFYASQPHSELVKLLEVNVWPVVLFTRWALERMQGRKPRSAIINVASICALCPYAGFSLYCATKKFDDFFTLGMANEVKVDPDMNVDILSLRPSYVRTEMVTGLKVKAPESSLVSPYTCVQGALKSLSRENYTAGAFDHKIETFQVQRNSEMTESKGYLASLHESS